MSLNSIRSIVQMGALALCIGVAGLLGWRYLAISGTDASSQSSGESETGSPPSEYTWPEPAHIDSAQWRLLRRGETSAAPESGPLAQRYRYAGNFFAFSDQGNTTGSGSRRGILDDIQQRRQYMVAEGDEIDSVHVVSIYEDRIVLRDGGVEESLWLSFAGGSRADTASRDTARAPQQPDTPLRFEDMPALETSRFGKRIGENRWVFDRSELITYYEEVMDDPERLTAVLLAMKPDHDGEDIAGFQLEKLGEDILYEAAGFQDGDIVRMVNHVPMTSGARAGFFISEFVNDRMNAIVLDIERGGVEQKLIYLIR